MRFLSRLSAVAFVGLVAIGPAATSSWATTIEDLIRLKSGKAPVSDDVLIALIEADGSVFHLTADDIKPLKEKGFSDKLIIAMLQTNAKARNVLVPLDARAVSQPVNVPHEAPYPTAPPVMQEPPPPVVYVTQTVTQTVEAPQQQPYFSNPIYYYPVALPVYPVARRPVIEQVYWGYGGQRRPDTWAPQRSEVLGQIPKPAIDIPAIRRY